MEYLKPQIELIVLETEDVITTSVGPLNPQPDDPDEELDFTF